MAIEERVCTTEELPDGTVVGAGKWAVGAAGGERFAVTRRCRHLGADLAKGSIDAKGCLVCPSHGSRYDVTSGQMVRGPQGIYAKIPGLGAAFKLLTKVIPLGRGEVFERGGEIFARDRSTKMG